MAGLKELLKKKEKISENHAPLPAAVQPPEFKFIRTTTDLHDTIEVPDFPDQPEPGVDEYKKKENRLTASFRRSLHLGSSNDGSGYDSHKSARPKNERRLSERLHLASSRSASRSPEPSAHVPSDLPDAPAYVLSSVGDKEEPQVRDQREAQWEKRATILAQSNPLAGVVGVGEPTTERGRVSKEPRERSATRSRSISNARGDENIQEAIRLHELGELTLSTAMFGRLADPARENIALAQVLYGLALRHGWGVPVESAKAIHYLSLAAANSANIEEQALASGMKRGGAAKGELVLAMFELANCFRHGWGVKCDPTAARQYYETAANLGDTDAMEEAAWCYLEGFGGPKDKFKAAQYLRLAEKQGSRAVGNSWIWKDKYNP